MSRPLNGEERVKVERRDLESWRGREKRKSRRLGTLPLPSYITLSLFSSLCHSMTASTEIGRGVKGEGVETHTHIQSKFVFMFEIQSVCVSVRERECVWVIGHDRNRERESLNVSRALFPSLSLSPLFVHAIRLLY